ncbi:MAG: YbjN domain-containing protein [Gemmatimonadota bacterium]
MTLTMERLKALLEGEKFKYFLDPAMDKLMLSARGLHGSYQLLVLLELEGQFIQFRSMNYHSCPVDHEHLAATLRVLGGLNYQLRFVKFGWDASDGEIVAYGDCWIEDGDLTQKQFGRMIHAYLAMMDLNYARIDGTVRTGEDPGEIGSDGGGGGPSGLPPVIQSLLDRFLAGLGGGGGGGGDDDDDDEKDDEGPMTKW